MSSYCLRLYHSCMSWRLGGSSHSLTPNEDGIRSTTGRNTWNVLDPLEPGLPKLVAPFAASVQISK